MGLLPSLAGEGWDRGGGAKRLITACLAKAEKAARTVKMGRKC